VLGAGGSARAVVFALVGVGAVVTVANRSPGRAEELGAAARALGSGEVGTIPLESGALVEAARGAELLVNTTSLGMNPSVDAMPPVPEECFLPSLFVYDLIYNPLETRLLRTARAHGARGTHGAGMLARQGALALEFWTGKPAPAALMEQVVLEELGHREERQPDGPTSGALRGPTQEVRARQDRQEQ
jgi:shikimate dehydrogenase